MVETNELMEPRVRKLEESYKALEGRVEKLHSTLNDALLGTVEGRPGIFATLQHSLEASKQNSAKLDALFAQVDSLRLDKAKVVGIVLACSALWSGLFFIMKMVLK